MNLGQSKDQRELPTMAGKCFVLAGDLITILEHVRASDEKTWRGFVVNWRGRPEGRKLPRSEPALSSMVQRSAFGFSESLGKLQKANRRVCLAGRMVPPTIESASRRGLK
jgi:hypothetical protein